MTHVIIIQGVRYQLTIYSKNVLISKTLRPKPLCLVIKCGLATKIFQNFRRFSFRNKAFPIWECKGKQTCDSLQDPLDYFFSGLPSVSKGLQR